MVEPGEHATGGAADTLRLDSLRRHVQTFAPSGIVDLSERELVRLDFEEDFGVPVSRHIMDLDISQNFLHSLPPRALLPLVALVELSLAHNQFEIFPSALLVLPSLTALNLSHNKLEHFPVSAESFSAGLPQLTTLDLAHNLLRSVPPCCGTSRQLQALNISHNPRMGAAPAQASDEGLRHCHALTELTATNCSLLEPPGPVSPLYSIIISIHLAS